VARPSKTWLEKAGEGSGDLKGQMLTFKGVLLLLLLLLDAVHP